MPRKYKKARKNSEARTPRKNRTKWFRYGSADKRVLTPREVERTIDKKVIRHSLVFRQRLRQALTAAFPEVSSNLLSEIAAHFADIWHLGEMNKESTAAILNMRFPKHQSKCLDVLYTTYIRLLGGRSESYYRSLKKDLPKLFNEVRRV